MGAAASVLAQCVCLALDSVSLLLNLYFRNFVCEEAEAHLSSAHLH